MRQTLLVFVVLAQGCAATLRVPEAGPRVIEADPGQWWDGAVFYEVFVRSFKDSDGDGKGDLEGLIEKLDVLNDGKPETTSDLGVDALWLMPVFQSPSYHGYDTTDYDTIEQDYGTNETFKRFLAEAHRRGIKVIVDLVVNHSSSEHPWFIDSASGPSSARRDWYVWRADDPGWGQPWNASGRSWHPRGGAYYYGVFWSGMPDLNYRTPAVREEMKRIATSWVGEGLDGFRLDAVRHLIETGPGPGQAGSPENHVYLKELRAALKAKDPRAMTVGEVWSTTGDIASYFGNGSDELDMLFDFPLAGALVKATMSEDATEVKETLRANARQFPPGAVDAPFLTNHDQTRLATQVARDQGRLRLAAALLLTMPGAPFIYYGEELGLPNGPGGQDEWKRTPMLWTETGPGYGFTTGTPWQETTTSQVVPSVEVQRADQRSLWHRYREVVRMRKASPALQRGTLTLLEAPAKVLAFVRQLGEERVVVVHNLSPRSQEVSLAVSGTAGEGLLIDSGVEVSRAGDGWKVVLPGRASAVFRSR